MRAIILLANICVLALAYWLGSIMGLLIAAALSLVFVVALFVFSTARNEARESRAMQRTMGRNTSFLASLRDR